VKLKDLKVGEKFLFVEKDAPAEIHEKKGNANRDYCLVGLPGVYDVFAVNGKKEVVTAN
jgi:hypothetical protein